MSLARPVFCPGGMTPPLHGILDPPLGSRRLAGLSIVIVPVGQDDRLLSSQQRIQDAGTPVPSSPWTQRTGRFLRSHLSPLKLSPQAALIPILILTHLRIVFPVMKIGGAGGRNYGGILSLRRNTLATSSFMPTRDARLLNKTHLSGHRRFPHGLLNRSIVVSDA